ncbi:MAG TPA: uracil-DNA glycosylase, partial [Anaeromyxobacteraceae bacterium]|nr:uracil-DNA glycosylase [Anaeromyxobacteraceae bacterium]
PGRTSLVFGVGNPRADLAFVGEGPGADEDREGEPFVGKAGQLLTRMIEAMGYRRQDVYIANVVKCRPPGNRNPEPDEIEACEPFLRGQLAAIAPKVIVALGKFAAQTLLRDTTPISRLRGRWFEYGGIRLMPTFHPAYLLRSPEEKKKAWDDLQLVMKELGKPLPGR